ncbi:MAG TPA: EamA family transporter [Mycobacterium sp.]|nr:EamA family transporter [Mycobacterium sp.]
MDSHRGRVTGVALMLGSALSTQTGAAVGALAFPVIGPVGVVAIRQWVAGAILLLVGRPRLREFNRTQWVPVTGLAAVFAVMNLAVYVAIDRIGLGLAVTLEFLGPLTIALAGALVTTPVGVRRRVTIACVLFATAGVLILARPQPTADYVGVGIGLLAAACWASYILLNRTVGERFAGAEGSAVAGLLSALVYVPIGIVALTMHPLTPTALALGAGAGVLASVVPFVADVCALRRVPAHFFGIFMSVNPVFAAAIGSVALGEKLGLLDWIAIGVIVTANVGAVLTTQLQSSAVSAEVTEEGLVVGLASRVSSVEACRSRTEA